MHLLHWNSLCCFLKWHPSCWLCAFNCCSQGMQSISLEPGGQFELSGAPVETLHQTCAEVNSHLYQVNWDRFMFLAFAWLVLRLIQLLGSLWYWTSVFFPNNNWETSKWHVSIKKNVFLHVVPEKGIYAPLCGLPDSVLCPEHFRSDHLFLCFKSFSLSRTFHSFASTLYIYPVTFSN